MQYKVDTAELDALLPRLRGLVAFVEDHLGQIDDRVRAMHDPDGGAWSGEAADEHARAHQEWTRGAARMRDGLAKMEAAARTAHDNYTATVAANLATLGRGSSEAGR